MSESTKYRLPSDLAQRAVFEKLNKQGEKTTRTAGETQEFYSSWAEQYDNDQSVFQHNSYDTVISTLAEVLPNESSNNYKNLCFLDIGSGTGNISETLHKHGFKGVIDGVEGNSEMNAVAKQKNIHRNLIVHFLTPDTPVPLDDASYDVITCCASLSPRSLPASTVLEMVRLLKPGGYIWYTTRDTSQHSIYNSKLNGLIDEMIQSEKVKDIIRRSFSYYTYEVKSENGGTEMFSLPGIERVLKKT